MVKQGSVGPSRSGDQFHYQWAARQCLALLGEDNGLVAVAIEGASLDEGAASTSKGSEVIDVGLYYGSEDITEATSIRYIQLKHSSKHTYKPWTVSGLRKTIEGFAERFKELEQSLGLEALKNKIRFVFLTNRPLDSKVQDSLVDISEGRSNPRHADQYGHLKSYAKSAGINIQDFFSIFSVEAGEPDLWEQRNLLHSELGSYLSEPDAEALLQLKELVTRRATDEGDNDRSIRRSDVLRVLHVDEIDLLPAPSLISEPKQFLLREQHADILATLLAAQHPVVIHADGGIGKSILSAQLSQSMPKGSIAVLYDCFGNGTYRQGLKSRHRYRDALVQIANELAGQRLCLPLIPTKNTDAKQFMRAFVSRLTQAIDLLRASNPQASLCIIIDAADNAHMAAQDLEERSFVHDLINTDMPGGVRLAFTCRSHRQDYLRAPIDVISIELYPFSKAETATHLRLNYPCATDDEAEEFAFLSSSNPRVQALAMEGLPPIGNMLLSLGPTPTTVQDTIEDLLTKAINRLKADWGWTESYQVDLICKGLAVLRPLVPVSILAQISGVSESAVRTFATELGRPLFVKESGMHFMDEPTETWFRETFKPDGASLDTFLERLKPLAKTSSYAAAALPQLLLSAGRMDELIELSLSTEGLPEKPMERRDVELQRLMFALRACLQGRRYAAAAKLVLKVGGEVAGESRQNTLIKQNTDITSVLLAQDRIEEMVSRRTFNGGILGFHHAYEAVFLSGYDDLIPEARSRLRMAWDLLKAWSKSPFKGHMDEHIDYADIADFAIAVLRLQGSAEAAKFLKGWSPDSTVLEVTRLVAARLADVGDFKGIDELAEHADGDVWLMLGLVTEAAWIAHQLPTESLRQLMEMLADPSVELCEKDKSWEYRGPLLRGVCSATTLALRCLPRDDVVWANTIRRYLPEEPPYHIGIEQTDLIRAYALESALRGKRLELIDLAPVAIRSEFESEESHNRSEQASQLKNTVGGVLKWFILAAEIACGRQPSDLDHEIELALNQTKHASYRDYHQLFKLDKVAALEWVKILRDSSAIKASQIDTLLQWVENNDRLYSNTLTKMSHLAARATGMDDLAIILSSLAFDQLSVLRSDAETKINDLQELARAIFCVSKSDAMAYFGSAIDIASKIGEEHLSRWTSFLNLAEAAHQSGNEKSRTAYRLARIAELSYEHMARDRYMDWDRLVEALINLCPSSSIAILSRWRDREFGSTERLLPVAIYSLIEHGFLPKKAAVALSGVRSRWNRYNDIKAALDAEPTENGKKLLLNIAYRYLRNEPYDEPIWRSIKMLADSMSMSLPDLDRLIQSAGSKGDSQSNTGDGLSLLERHEDTQKPKWDEIFNGLDLCDADSVLAACQAIKNIDGRSYVHEFYAEGCRRAKLKDVAGYLCAIQLDDEFNVFRFLAVIENLPEASKKLLSVRSELKRAALLLATREPSRVGRLGWGYEGPFDKLYNEGTVVELDVASARLEGYQSQLDTLDANDLFHVMEPIALHLSHDEADEVLNFGFDLLEEILEAKDGDGPWRDSLAPSLSCEESVAGYLWAGLARPSTSERWQYAHCIRNCLELEWQPILSALAIRASSGDPQPFVDNGLVFYEWHARQWLCIALARGAMDAPGAVTPFLAFLESCARGTHVVIRHFASHALKHLNTVYELSSDLLAITQSVNRPLLPTKVYDQGEQGVGDDDLLGFELKDNEKYFFGIDIGPYWFAPLGRVFGLSQKSIEQRAIKVLRDRMLVEPLGRSDDPRYKRGLFQYQKTTHSHGSKPEVEDCNVYQSYHSMMFVAGLLLDNKPVQRRVDEEDDPFEDWLRSQLLTRDDDRWLADRRDPELLNSASTNNEQSDSSWCWTVDKQYLDAQLTTGDGMTALWGEWTNTVGSNDETVSVRSVFVPSLTSNAFLTAMQTSSSPGDIYFPSADPDYYRQEVDDPELRMIGWVNTKNNSLNLDQYDPWAGKIECPGPRPCQEFLELLNPIMDSDYRSWILENTGRARSESWARYIGNGNERHIVTGSLLSADLKFIRALLDVNPNRSLIIRITIHRKSPKNDVVIDGSYISNYPYNRYYLIGQDGITRTL